jgi:hypothetical protein
MAGPPDETPRERLNRYRKLAIEARELAETADSDDLHQAYLALVDGWAALAADLEKAIRRREQ